MTLGRIHLTRPFLIATILCVALGTVSLIGCSKSSSKTTQPPAPTTTSFTGTLAGSTVSGLLGVSIATATPGPNGGASTVTATGSLHLVGGGDISLTGVYDTAAHTLALTGGGYSLAGLFSGGKITGTFTGPGGINGGFTMSEGASGTVKVFCGTFTATGGGSSGNFNLVINGTVISGIAVATDGSEIPLSGTLSGTAISIVNPNAPTGPPLATGTLDTTHGTVSGTYDDGAGASGNWTGGPC